MSYEEHVEQTVAREVRAGSAMPEMEEGTYEAEVDEAEKGRQWGEDKEFCEGTCGREYTMTTLNKYNGMCSRCRDAWFLENGGAYSDENALSKGHFEHAKEMPESEGDSEEEEETDSDSEEESDSEADEAYSSEEEEDAEPKAKRRKIVTRSQG